MCAFNNFFAVSERLLRVYKLASCTWMHDEQSCTKNLLCADIGSLPQQLPVLHIIISMQLSVLCDRVSATFKASSVVRSITVCKSILLS